MGSAIAAAKRWQDALESALPTALVDLDGAPDLVFLFASAVWREVFPELVARVRERTGARRLVGCSGQGVIGSAIEVEGEPALALMALALPGAVVHAAHLTHQQLAEQRTGDDVRRLTGAPMDDVDGWIVLADPFTLDPEGLLGVLTAAYPAVPLIGGLASGLPGVRATELFLDDRVESAGAVCLAIGGDYTIRTVVSQGCQPIGETWTITAAERNVIATISNRPAYQVLIEAVRNLSPLDQARARGNLLVGLAIDERRDRFERGDFLIRNLIGADPRTGAIAVAAAPRIGQTIQFQLRDAAAADEDLTLMLQRAAADLSDQRPVGALLCSCNGRGVDLFGVPNHDAARVAERLGPLPLAGLFCNGEIGPVGGRPYLHGFTASLGLIVPKRRPAGD